MISEHKEQIEYFIRNKDFEIKLNEILNKKIKISFLNEIYCILCGKKTPKSFGQGFCYPCFVSVPETEECVFNPELCRAHEGIARDMKYAEENCLKEHYVYLAISSHIKVGVTRKSQIPTRWIDQGASKAMKLCLTPNRFTAGLIEVELKKHLPDKTNWQKMLKNEIDLQTNILFEKQKVIDILPDNFRQYISDENIVYEFNYPVLKYPKKVKSLSLDTNNVIEGILTGIKGQYLIFDDGSVLNIRKFGGYLVYFEF